MKISMFISKGPENLGFCILFFSKSRPYARKCKIFCIIRLKVFWLLTLRYSAVMTNSLHEKIARTNVGSTVTVIKFDKFLKVCKQRYFKNCSMDKLF